MSEEPFFLPLGVGVDSELADKLVQPGEVLTLEDAFSDVRGQIVKRGGSVKAATSASVFPGGLLSPPWRYTTKDGNLVRFDEAPSPIGVWAPEATKFATAGDATASVKTFKRGPTSVNTTPVFSSTPAGDQVSTTDVATGNGYAVTCYEHSSGLLAATSARVTLTDLSTKSIVAENRLPASTRRPRPVVVGNVAVVVYDDNGTLSAVSFDLNTLVLLHAPVAIVACTPGTPIDVIAGSLSGTPLHVSALFRDNAGFLSCADILSTNIATSTVFQIQNTTLDLNPTDLAFGWIQDLGASGKFAVMTASTADGLLGLWDLPAPSAGVSAATSTQVLDGAATAAPVGATAGIRNIIGATNDANAAGHYRVLYEVTAPSFQTTGVIKSAVWNGASITLATAYRGIGIRSKLWANDTSFYFWATWCGTNQETYFAMAMSSANVQTVYPAPQATAFVRNGGGLTEKTSHPSSVALGNFGEIITAVTHVTRPESVASGGTAVGAVVNVKAVDLISLTHRRAGDTVLGRPLEFIGSLFTPGGMLGCFDGFGYGSAGFATFPEMFSVASAAGGNLTHSATYRYVAVYSRVDRSGRKWRSSGSIPVEVSTTGSNFQFNLSIESLRLIEYGETDGSEAGYQIEIYRTQANETAAFFLTASIPNDPLNAATAFTDNVADANLGEELYTDGGGMGNQLTPGASDLAEFDDRFFMSENGRGTLWYSLDIDLNHGLLFNEVMTLDVGNPADPITAIHAGDAGLICWKADSVWIVSGQGANALGQGATYAARRIDQGIGTSNPCSVVASPDSSLWFKSNSTRAGFYRLNGLSLEYVGQGVRKYNDLTVVSAVSVSQQSQLRFYTSEGRTLVWNWNAPSTWGTYLEQPCLTATAGYSGSAGIVYANTSAETMIEQERGAVFTEGGTAFVMHVAGPWWSVTQVGTWNRIKRIQGVGSAGGPHRVQIKLFRDWNDAAPFQTLSKQFDGTETGWNWEVLPSIQKLSALKIDIEIHYDVLPRTFAIDAADNTPLANEWEFTNGAFNTVIDAASVVTPAFDSPNGAFNIPYTVTSLLSSTLAAVTPNPHGLGFISPPSGTATVAAPDVTPNVGPSIIGVTLIVDVKSGLKKLASSRRAT